MKTPIAVLFFLASVVFYSCDSNTKKDSTDVAEERNEEKFEDRDNLKEASDFAVEAASSSMMEVEMGKIASEKATSPQVKQFAQKMVNDHSAANTKLKQIAQAKNITLPDSLPEDHKDHLKDLREKSGNEFDKEYMSMMVDEHKDDVDKFESASNDLDDPDLKAFASETLPKLRQHREEAEKIHESVKEKN